MSLPDGRLNCKAACCQSAGSATQKELKQMLRFAVSCLQQTAGWVGLST